MAAVMEFGKRRVIAARLACMIAGAFALAVDAPLQAQVPGSVAQPQPPPALGDLNSALAVLAHNPADVGALLRAGWASLALDDTQAALGFFRRVESTAPGNGEAKAGEASAMLRLDDPVTAVSLFAEAEAVGTPMARYAGDRGLALDLVGENLAAQRFYRQALAQRNDPDVVRRLALSQAISGDQRGSEATLLPLLQARDLAAYRTRAFSLAILGHGEEAVSIVETMLPAALSNRMAPYLRYMPRLTRAQQAAAANLGEFPRASEIGHDDPKIAALAGTETAQIAERSLDARLVPTGQPLGRSGTASGADRDQRRGRTRRSKEQGNVTAVADAQRLPASAANTAPAPPVQREAAPQAVPPAVEQPAPPPSSAPVVVATLDSPPPAAPPLQDKAVPRPSISVAAATPVPSTSDAKPNSSLADTFADIASADAAPAPSAPGAVDISKIKPARDAPKPPPAKAKPKPPANPSRIWVQIGTGRNVKALAFTWRRLSKEAGALLARHDAYSARWGQTRRLITGPFKSDDEAREAIKALKKKGINSFEFTSDEGEEVTPLK